VKTAVNEMGEPIAAESAPGDRALCPYCGGIVTRRYKRLMDGCSVAYWRHRNNRDTDCQGRSRRVIADTASRSAKA
jgi:hypothetical protein